MAEIDVEKEIAEANARLPVALPDTPMPLEIQIRSVALAVAQRHCGDTVVSEGALYQQLKMDNKLGDVMTVEHVVRAALVFERFLWGEWSKGIAENALESTLTDAADAIEREFEARKDRPNDGEGEPPIRPHAGKE